MAEKIFLRAQHREWKIIFCVLRAKRREQGTTHWKHGAGCEELGAYVNVLEINLYRSEKVQLEMAYALTPPYMVLPPRRKVQNIGTLVQTQVKLLILLTKYQYQ